MAWDNTKLILRNTTGEPVPQVWDDDAQAFVIYEGTVEVENPTGESLDVQVMGSIEEHTWVDGDAEPTPTATRAIGLVFDPGTDDVTVKIWTGAAWEVM